MVRISPVVPREATASATAAQAPSLHWSSKLTLRRYLCGRRTRFPSRWEIVHPDSVSGELGGG